MTDNTGSEQAPLVRLAMSRNHRAVVEHTIDRWWRSELIDYQTALKLSESLVVAPFDWLKAARYAFIVSISCLVLAVGSALADDALMRLLMRLFDAPAIVKCGLCGAVSAGIFGYGLMLRRRRTHRPFGDEMLFFQGALALAASVYFLGVAVDPVSVNPPFLFLVATILYTLTGFWFPSKVLWVLGLLSLGAWVGAQTDATTGVGYLFLGIDHPLRFAVFGAVLAMLGLAGQRLFDPPPARESSFLGRLLSMSPETKVIGLLNLFISLWLLSMDGNRDILSHWKLLGRHEVIFWSLLFGAVAVAAIWDGLKHDDGVLRGFGMTFLLVNLYTKYFEYFWDHIHNALFFGVLAISFWFLGSRAEAIWALGTGGVKHRSRADGPTEPSAHDDGEAT